jgi:hypothetical protein
MSKKTKKNNELNRYITKFYLPNKYLFYPFYKLLRKKKKVSQKVSIFSTYMFSGILHGIFALLLVPNNKTAILLMFTIFPIIGLIKIVNKNR